MTGPSTGEAGPVCPGGQAGGDSGAVETLLQASRVLVGIASRGLEQLGEEVTNSQFRLLSVLGEYGPIASVEAAGWLGSAGSSVTALRKIVSRGQLYHSRSVSGEPGRAADLMNPPVTVDPDHTLREVRALFATYAVTAAPVVDPGPDHSGGVIGLITGEHLLDGRLPDLAEEHHPEPYPRPLVRPPEETPSRTTKRRLGDPVFTREPAFPYPGGARAVHPASTRAGTAAGPENDTQE